MENYYSSAARFPVGVDCIIFGLVGGSLCLLLTRRSFEPAKGEWSLMGGFVDADESVDDAARRILRQLTGLENIYMEQVGAFGEVDRDPGDRVVSVAYFALLGASEYDSERLEAHAAEWVDLAELPDLCFDHPRMIRAALEQLRAKISLNPISFNLLPEMFTLSQLQALHETILGRSIDKRNFRKRIAELNCIERTGAIDKSSRRGAALYRFNTEVYKTTHNFKINSK